MKHVLCVLGALALCSASFASFDLVLVGDAGTSTEPASIKRFDGRTGAYLGSFANGELPSVAGVVADRSLNIAYVQTAYGVKKYNYNTGEYLGYLMIGSVSGSLNLNANHDLYGLTASSSVVTINHLTGTTNSTTLAAGVTARWICQAPDTQRYYLGDAGASPRILVSDAGALTNFSSAATSFSSYMGTSMMGSAFVNTSVTGYQRSIVTTASVSYYNTVFGIATGVAIYGGEPNPVLAVAAGHQGFYTAFQKGVNVGSVHYVDDNFLISSAPFGEGVLRNPTCMATVLAPEPGTWIALGLGSIAMLRRRRK